jgi:regulator of ribonuclease activity A
VRPGGGPARAARLRERLDGIVVDGCIRDSEEISRIPIGVKARHAVPKKSAKGGLGERDVPVRFAGLTFTPGDYLYADPDGIIVAERDQLV